MLEAWSGSGPVRMMLANDELRTVLVTIHVALRRAIELVTFDAIARHVAHRPPRGGGLGPVEPRIAVAGLNPHAGEGGLFGDEEVRIIAPAIAMARGEGIDARAPFAPDTVFMRARDTPEASGRVRPRRRDDPRPRADPGQITLGLADGVNATLGLPASCAQSGSRHGVRHRRPRHGRPGEPARRCAWRASWRRSVDRRRRRRRYRQRRRAVAVAGVVAGRAQRAAAAHRRALEQVTALEARRRPASPQPREHARSERQRLLMLASVVNAKKAAPAADAAQAHLLPAIPLMCIWWRKPTCRGPLVRPCAGSGRGDRKVDVQADVRAPGAVFGIVGRELVRLRRAAARPGRPSRRPARRRGRRARSPRPKSAAPARPRPPGRGHRRTLRLESARGRLNLRLESGRLRASSVGAWPFERLGVRRQQLAEEPRVAPVRPADQRHALVGGSSSSPAAASGRPCSSAGVPLGLHARDEFARRGAVLRARPAVRRVVPPARAPGSTPATGTRAGSRPLAPGRADCSCCM